MTPEPTEQKKSDGWVAGEKPPEVYMNWWQKLVYLWLAYLDNLTNEALTWAAAHIFNGTVTFNGGITVPTPTAATDAATKQYVDDHVTDATGAHAASAIANTPAGNIAATTVQAALNELDTEKAALAGASFTGAVSVPTPTAAAHAARRDMAGQDGMVTRPKLAAVGQQISASCGYFSTSSASLTDVTNLSVTLTTSGRPVRVALQPDAGSLGLFGAASGSVMPFFGYLAILRGTTDLGRFELTVPAANQVNKVPCSAIALLDTPAAGTYTYKVQAACFNQTGGGYSVAVENSKLVVFEL